MNLRKILLLMLLTLLVTGCVRNTYIPGFAGGIKPLENEESTEEINVEGFDDINLPAGMVINNKESMSLRTNSFRSGVLEYSGRIDPKSLRKFIISSMGQNDWQIKGEASQKETLLAFTKKNKTCMFYLKSGIGGPYGKTFVTVYIAIDE